MIEFPFPYKFNKRGRIKDGVVIQSPECCTKNHNSNDCTLFYSNLPDTAGLYRCPFGFCVNVEYINEQKVYFCGLNVSSISDRKKVLKNIKKLEYNLVIPKERYVKIIDALRNNVIEDRKLDCNISKQIDEDDFLDKKILVEDTIHELRKLNREFKAQCEDLIDMMDDLDDSELHSQARKVFATSQLMTIRLDTYDFGMNPAHLLSKSKQPMCIHKKITKAAKSLFAKATANNVYVRWEGESHCDFMATDVVELLPYIIIENGIKYSLPQKDLVISFNELQSDLLVTIRSFSLRPLDSNTSNLFNRGFRDPNAAHLKQGNGIGLYLASVICKYHDIGISVELGNDRESRNGYIYSDFIVSLKFPNIIKHEN